MFIDDMSFQEKYLKPVTFSMKYFEMNHIHPELKTCRLIIENATSEFSRRIFSPTS